jgi:hypothetical protein
MTTVDLVVTDQGFAALAAQITLVLAWVIGQGALRRARSC